MNSYYYILITFVISIGLMSCNNSRITNTDLDYTIFEKKLAANEFENIAEIISKNQISNENYLDWSYTFQTRNEDGVNKIKQLENTIYMRADSDETYLKEVGVFYSKWPQDVLLEMKKRAEHPGSTKIANYALRLSSNE